MEKQRTRSKPKAVKAPSVSSDHRLLSISELSLERNVTKRFLREAIKHLKLASYDLGVLKIRVSEFDAWVVEYRKHRKQSAS